MTDHLAELAEAALRKNQPSRFQASWEAAVELPSTAEEAYIKAASPAVVLRLIRRIKQLENK